jgi:hypothetical protein
MIATHDFLTRITEKAKIDQIFMKKVKRHQGICSKILYFMQSIPEDRKSTICMRYIRNVAEKSVKMNI